MHRREILTLLGTTAGIAWSPSVGSGSRSEFDPAIHGFGFPNWSGTRGETADGTQFSYEPAEISFDDVEDAIDGSWETSMSAAQRAIMNRIVYAWIGGNAATNGHCYGMAFAADTYARDPGDLPVDVETASEIPHPTGEYAEVGDQIRRLQTAQLLRAEPFWFGLLGLRWGLSNHEESLAELIDVIDATGTAGLALDGEADAHQVLAHDYDRRDDDTVVSIYDPNYEAEEYEESGAPWRLVVETETGDVREIRDGYEEFLFHHPDLDLGIVDRLIGGRDRVLDALSNAVFLGLEAGSAVEIDVPDDVRIDRPDAEYADPELAPYADAAVVFNPPDTFEMAIEGEVGETYEIELLGLRDAELVLDDIVSGTFADESARLQLRPDDAGEMVVEVLEEVEETSEPEMERPWLEERWVMIAAGGALGIGAGYLYLTHRSEDANGDHGNGPS